MSKHKEVSYHIPTRPYSPIDALNRRAAALGSPGYAMGAAHADYNGHRVTVSWNSYRRYYIAEYFWAGRRVLARGSFESCLRAALREYERGALGSSTAIYPREDDLEAQALCDEQEEVIKGDAPKRPEWMTWRHDCAAQSARDSAHPGVLVMMFNWELLQASESEQAYEAALKEKYGRAWM